ncbi:MAG: sugar transferase [Chloroflexota bacterium]
MKLPTMEAKQWVNHSIQTSIYQPIQSRTEQLLRNLIVVLFILSDLLMMTLAFHIGKVVAIAVNPAMTLDGTNNTYTVFIILSWIVIYGIAGLYGRRRLFNNAHEFRLIFQATTSGALAIIFVGYMWQYTVIDRWWLMVAWGLSFLMVGLGRSGVRLIIYLIRKRGHLLVPTLLVGVSPESYYLGEQFAQSKSAGIRIVGFADDNLRVGAKWGNFPVVGSIAQLDELIRNHNIEEIIISTGSLDQEQLLSLFKRYGVAQGINLRLTSGLFEMITTGVKVEEIASVPLAHINKVRLTGTARLTKMLTDYFITIPGLIIGSPILLALAIAVKLDSPGPIIHRRRVVGVNGKEFDAFKFRTMHVNGDEILAQHPDLQAELARNHKLKDDPRITRIGNVLRKYSLDELPQLFNVVRQEMSLIGPRMIAPNELAKYNQWDVNLLTMRPGISGLWQVSGRSDLTYEERVRLDMYYNRNWSFGLDLSLIARTIPVLLFGKGAY